MIKFAKFTVVLLTAVTSVLACSAQEHPDVSALDNDDTSGPASGQCCNYFIGGTSHVHYYSCCNVAGLNSTVTYQNASNGNYCNATGSADGGTGGGSAGTSGGGTVTLCYPANAANIGTCNNQCGVGRILLCYVPGFCWSFTGCFKNCMKRLNAAGASKPDASMAPSVRIHGELAGPAPVGSTITAASCSDDASEPYEDLTAIDDSSGNTCTDSTCATNADGDDAVCPGGD